MKHTRWLLGIAVLFLGVTVAAAADNKGNKPPNPKDVFMAQALEQFNRMDLDKDGFIDKDEAAKAFRGPTAKGPAEPKPKEGSKEGKPAEGSEGSKAAVQYDLRLPDQQFIAGLDDDGDGKVSREEFGEIAKQNEEQFKKMQEYQQKLEQYQRDLARKLNDAQRRDLQRRQQSDAREYQEMMRRMQEDLRRKAQQRK